ncbi:Metallo-dependent phosphatase-like protein [Papiliotrema laurentii]|uniref:Metallo-dependent phosphatase-like protein n=1 Tax=Papiliotrema laurentii TaxID=5418 RepID=A0AAD9CTB2_PAPLA|nr:Metallo-dependent phosphatase-like protein [Papiliotrema laurentii]
MPKLLPEPPGQRKRPRWAYIRSLLPVLAILLIFSFLLASYSLLSHFRSPAAKQRLGWQSWDVIHVKTSQTVQETAQTNGSDWVPSIPIDVWDPLAIHTTGLTEITVKACSLPPYLLPAFCSPETTPELDKTKGKWVAVERDLNIRSGLWYLNVYYRRTRRLDVPLITGLRIVPDPVPDTLQPELNGWIQAAGDLHSGVWPRQPVARLWYKLQDRSMAERQQMTDTAVITEVDVVYGDDDPFYGFQRVDGGKVLEAKEGKWESVDIAYRRGNPTVPKTQPPRFHPDGTLKIMQIADLHYSVGSGSCRDTDKQPCRGDAETAAWLEEALDAERPDMVVFSGDQLNGQGTSYDSRSVLAKFAKPVIDRKIPWAAVFGNHDSEISGDRESQMRALQHLPYSLSQLGPEGVDGYGNYVIKLHSADASRMHLFTLYFLDSHDYQGRSLPWLLPDYDYIKPSQINWFLNASASIKPIERPFQPDGADDLGHIWKRSRPARLTRQTEKHLAKPNAIMWFHIPLPEAYAPADKNDLDGTDLNVGDQLDGDGSSKHNSGFFANGIQKALEVDGLVSNASEVKVLSHGHCHNTDRCRRVNGVWMCFDGGSSYSGYGQLGFDRRVRVYHISQYGERVETYKRLTSGEIIDRQVLVGNGAPPAG